MKERISFPADFDGWTASVDNVSADQDHGPTRILIVDDEAAILELCERLLERDSFEIVTVQSASMNCFDAPSGVAGLSKSPKNAA